MGPGFRGLKIPREALFSRCQESLVNQRKGGMALDAAAFQFFFANHAE